MNRKGALGAIIAAVASAVALARGQETRLPTRSTTLSLSEEELRKRVAELESRVQELSTVQANTVGFTRAGDNWVFAPSSGSVMIKAPVNVLLDAGVATTVRASATLTLVASGNVKVTGGTIALN